MDVLALGLSESEPRDMCFSFVAVALEALLCLVVLPARDSLPLFPAWACDAEVVAMPTLPTSGDDASDDGVGGA